MTALFVLAGFSFISGCSGAANTAPTPVATPLVPTMSLAAGTFSSSQTLSIVSQTAGATIYYTTDGTAPTSASAQYTSAITVNSNETVKAIATLTGASSSAVVSATYAFLVPTPTLSLASGTYSGTQSVTIADPNTTAAIYYTTDGSAPTASSTKYAGTLTVSSTETLQAIAAITGYTSSATASAKYTYLVIAQAPTMSLTAGTYGSSQALSMVSPTAGATVYYTTDGTTPTSASTLFTSPITVNSSETVNAIATLTGGSNSPVVSAAYVFLVPTPTLSLASGTYSGPQSVTIADPNSTAAIYYTTDGSVPSASSTKYVGVITVSSTETLKAIAAIAGYTGSATASATYTTTTAPTPQAPTLSLAAGNYNSAQTLSMVSATTGATIYYTTDGTVPSTASTQYTGPITVNSNETVQAVATLTGAANSMVASAAYAFLVATPTLSLPSGTYVGTQSVTITDPNSAATIYYTTNGQVPTASSTAYAGAISVNSTETLQAIAVIAGYTDSATTSATYTYAYVFADQSAAAFAAFNAAYLVQANQPYYSTTLATLGNVAEVGWQQALDITVAFDAYQLTPSSTNYKLAISLENGLVTTPWPTDGNDHLGLMVNGILRGYEVAGWNPWLTQAEAGWNLGYTGGWDTTAGGIWKDSTMASKCALSNDPYVWEGVQISQLTGTATYLTQAKAIYEWVRTNLVNTTSVSNGLGAPGQVNGCVGSNGAATLSDNVSDAGSFVEAAAYLYRVTGSAEYHDDALLTINHIVGEGSILPYSGGEVNQQEEYWFTRGLSDFATWANLWSTYLPYLQANAMSAWTQRDSSLNITWNDWNKPTDVTGSDANEMSSAVAVWQHLPPVYPLSGTWEMQDERNGMAVEVDGSATTSGAKIVHNPFVAGDTSFLWTFTPTSGGYYRIVNVKSGMVIDVAGGSTTPGAFLVQAPAQTTILPGDDEWLPTLNADGSYTFYNFNSKLSLNDTWSSTTAGEQYSQWWPYNSTSYEFMLIAH